MYKDNLMDELCKILVGNKKYKLEYNILELTSCNSGKKIYIDLNKLMEEYPEVMEEIISEKEEF